MKKVYTSIIAAAMTIMMGGVASADPTVSYLDNFQFSHAEDAVSSTAACLVSAGNPGPGIAACGCWLTGDPALCTARTTGTFAIHPLFEASWAAALAVDDTLLTAPVLDGYFRAPNPGTVEFWNVKMDTTATCGLTQANLELALSMDPASAKSKLRGMIGAQAQYSAVYAFPVRAPGTSPTPEQFTSAYVNAPDGGQGPVRLCALGQAKVLAAGSLRLGHGGHQSFSDNMYGSDGHRSSRTLDLSASISAMDIGMSGAASWVVPNFPEQNLTNTFGVRYVVVVGVADAVLQVGMKKRVDAVGVLANARITNRTLSIVRNNNQPNFWSVDDQDLIE